ncbi:hypothetical protein EK21DRAFT_114560 [Setomelanomma holmii]|uniref:Uncharacterized protein n=1 Tax=Setomelanomma holmii TaxID=210430 RepID=A0A9P4H3Y8_9PLEO|nr:hypothetical protein EK21DRAFT_114560 [Setomelanomma holmii]
MADTAAINVNNVATLDKLVSPSGLTGLGSDPSPTSLLLGCILPNLNIPNIGLRLPLTAFTACDPTSEFGSSEIVSASTWARLPFAIQSTTKLRGLNVRLDHDLPKLHPMWAHPDRHLTDNGTPPPFVIHRRYRQKYHGIEASDGRLSVKYSPDFLILHELVHFDLTIEEVEELEGKIWERGDDPMDDVRAMESSLCGVSNI